MRVETEIYRAIARLAARNLGTLDEVIGVYARRSVAVGEVVLGRSDIDLHAVIAPPASLDSESALLSELARRFARMKRLAPCLGHLDVSTRRELDAWYREQPFQWYRDRAWLPLDGEEFERPRGGLHGSGKDRILWWFFWAALLLPKSFRAGDARTCCNLVLDMFDVYRLYVGSSDEPLSRAALVELWSESRPPGAERDSILRAYRRGFRGHRGAALVPLYRESLALHDALFAQTAARLEGSASGTLASRVPPRFTGRTYVLVDVESRRALDEALETMRRDETVWVLTEAGLKLYLLHRNPWEHRMLSAAGDGFELVPPPRSAFRQVMQRFLYREIPRHYGLCGDRRHIGPLYAQTRLYAAEQLVAADGPDLRRAYRRRYGGELLTDGSRQEYFRDRYPVVCRIIDEARSSLAGVGRRGAGPPLQPD